MPIHLSPSLLTWLRCFDAVARHGSATQAALALHVTQGSISQQVRKLEDYLGTALFLRTRQGLSLTPDGEQLLRATDHAFPALQHAIGALRRDPARGHAPLGLSCSPSFAMQWLAPRVRQLQQEEPEHAIRLVGEFHTLDRQGMARHGIQAGIRFDPGHHTGLQALPFLDEWLVPVASPAFLQAHPALQQATDLPATWMLHDEAPWDGAPPCIEWNTWLTAAGVPLPRHSGAQFNLSQMALMAALAGQGVAMGRLALVFDALRNGSLIAPFPLAVPSNAAYHYLTASDPHDSVNRVGNWLQRQGSDFARQRHALLQQLGIRLHTAATSPGHRPGR